MKEWLSDLLFCPVCKNKLTMEKLAVDGNEIVDGILSCRCKRWYPISMGIPRLIRTERLDEYFDYTDFQRRYGRELETFIREQLPSQTTEDRSRRVRGTYSYIWNRFSRFAIDNPAKEQFYDDWMVEKLGVSSTEELHSFIRQKNSILEVGVGSGQKLKMMASHTKGRVIGLDLSAGAAHAYENTRDLENVGVVQADLFAPPFEMESFDFIISDGVLHHTSDTHKAFLQIVPMLNKGGQIVIRVYKRSGPIREFCDDYIRSRTTCMSEEEAWDFCRSITEFGESLAQLREEFVVPQDIELLGIKKGKYNVQRFFYEHVFKCFFNSIFDFDENNLVNFDWYHPLDAHRHTEEEVASWFKEAGLTSIRTFSPRSGISAIGNRE